MTASVGFLSFVISIAVVMTIVSPIILLIMWFKDWKSNKLW